MPTYFIIQCPKCGLYQATTSKKSIKCKFCNKSTALVSKDGYARANKGATTTDPREAVRYVQTLNEKKMK